MDGAFIGLDYAAALAIAPPGLDRETFAAFLLKAEAGMLSGLANRADP